MFRHFALIVALFALCGLVPGHGIAAPAVTSRAMIVADPLPPLFSTETAAQEHCPKDVVLWLNVPNGIYHYRGERWHELTRHGEYACEKEAIKAGDRAGLNGQ